jgi:hypothetical protein
MMPRVNDKPFDCKDCRFNIDGSCWRNPAQTTYLNFDKVAVRPDCETVDGCFAGEPLVPRSCQNCGVTDCRVFLALDNHKCGEVSLDDLLDRNWHCCDWIEKKQPVCPDCHTGVVSNRNSEGMARCTQCGWEEKA